MIDLLTESLLPLAQASQLLPPGRRRRPIHFSTVLRWTLRGLKDPSGEVVRLEAIRLGGRWLTSREALQRFAGRLTPDLSERAPTPRTPAAQTRAARRAEEELKRLGI